MFNFLKSLYKELLFRPRNNYVVKIPEAIIKSHVVNVTAKDEKEAGEVALFRAVSNSDINLKIEKV